jgi:hypothetical protein
LDEPTLQPRGLADGEGKKGCARPLDVDVDVNVNVDGGMGDGA